MKLQGFYPPTPFLSVLAATVADPSPVDYGKVGESERERILARGLSDAQRGEISAVIDGAYDRQHGGWGRIKSVDGPSFDWMLDRALAGDKEAEARIRKTLTSMLALVDKDVGAIRQVAMKPDWTDSPREFPMFAQQAALAAYLRAWTMFGDAAYRTAADRIFAFLKNTMVGPGGGFYTSMGLAEGQAGIDRRHYSRETGQAIAGLVAYYDATGDKSARDIAIAAADWALRERGLPQGGFRHDARDTAGPFLADSVEMGWAFILLHRSTADRKWLTHSAETAEFIISNFIEPRTGGFVATAAPEARYRPKPVKQREYNVKATRFFNLLSFYTGQDRYREVAEAGMGHLVSPPLEGPYSFLPDVLRTETELKNEPVHITVVGAKADPRAAALFASALRYPDNYKRAEWWDKSEGRLTNHDIEYEDHPDGPAAFACTRNFCSLPVTDPAAISAQIARLQRSLPEKTTR